MNTNQHYLVSQDDAYRIEELISTLAMAVWEILEMHKITVSTSEDDGDTSIAQNMFEKEARRIHTELEHTKL